jgi:tetratricopeptide (TPR) repeat protein
MYEIRIYSDDAYASTICNYVAIIASDFDDYLTATKYLDKALDFNPTNVTALATSAVIANEMRANNLLEPHEAFWRARRACDRATAVVREHMAAEPGAPSVFAEQMSLVEALVTIEDWGEASRLLRDAQFYRPDDLQVEGNLGVVAAGNKDHEAACTHFKNALAKDRTSLRMRSNLAEALRRQGRSNEAIEMYQAILGVSAVHVQSLLGLGEAYAALGDDGQDSEEHFLQAVNFLQRGIGLGTNGLGSHQLTKEEVSAAQYSCGYAYAKLYEASKSSPNLDYLKRAALAFAESQRSGTRDREKAAAAARKLEDRLKEAMFQKATQWVGPLLVGTLAVLIFALAQTSFFLHVPIKNLAPVYHGMLTFGSLLFLIASLYLPSLLRLKLAGIELEKRPVDQITAARPLGITH